MHEEHRCGNIVPSLSRPANNQEAERKFPKILLAPSIAKREAAAAVKVQVTFDALRDPPVGFAGPVNLQKKGVLGSCVADAKKSVGLDTDAVTASGISPKFNERRPRRKPRQLQAIGGSDRPGERRLHVVDLDFVA